MDDFSRSLAAAALLDGQRFSLPDYGTLAGCYVSARINHAERQIEPPTLDLTWSSQVDDDVQTFEELLIATGATSWEAKEMQEAWLTTLAAGEPIYLGDLGVLQLDQTSQVVGFTPHKTALEQAYWASGAVELSPLQTRSEPTSIPTAPVVPINLKQTADQPSAEVGRQLPARSPRAKRAWRAPFAVAASVLLCALALWVFLRQDSSSELDETAGQVVAVNQDRLTRSPRELAPPESIGPDTGNGFVAGGAASTDDEQPLVDAEQYDVLEEDISSQPSELNAPTTFDPASLAGGPGADDAFEAVPIEAVIVIGSFGQADNAARMTERIASAGLLPYVDQQGELTRVGVSFEASSEQDIAIMMQQLRADFNPNAWLLE